jgi:transcriptional regulator with XRE-family HTH domain
MVKRDKMGNWIGETPEDLAEILGLRPSIVLEWKMRSEITAQIIETFKKKKMSITNLALKSQTSRARITKILKGDDIGISLDVLFRVLGATGQGVQLKFLKVS